MSRFEFQECSTCAKKLGSPELCKSCLHNRTLIDKLSSALRWAGRAHTISEVSKTQHRDAFMAAFKLVE